jgi:hypothetical protein
MKKLILFSLLISLNSFAANVIINLNGVDIRLPNISPLNLYTEEATPIFNKIELESSQDFQLKAVYLSTNDANSIALGSNEPEFKELITIRYVKKSSFDATDLKFASDVSNEVEMLLDLEDLLDDKAAAIDIQERQVLNSPNEAEDKTITVLMPSGPFIYDKNTLAYSIVNYSHQTKDGVITEFSRIVSTLLIYYEGRFINVGFYKTVAPENAPKELALEADKIKNWYKEFIKLQNEDAIAKAEAQGDYASAIKLALAIANQGDEYYQYKVGLLYLFDNVQNNAKESIKWFEKSAEQGFVPAMYWLGESYNGKLGSLPNYNKAAYWYKKAAQAGEAQAQEALAEMYEEGNGVLQDYSMAFMWRLKAAEQDNLYAMIRVGLDYCSGTAVKQDFVKSKYWLSKAFEHEFIFLESHLKKNIRDIWDTCNLANY